MSTRSAASLVLRRAVLLQACAGAIAGGAETPAPERGRFTVEPGQAGLVIGSPHGTSDRATDLIGLELAGRTGWGVVVATGFSHLDAEGRRLNVNRPTESVPGVAPRLEAETAEARLVYEAYRAHLMTVAQGSLRLYVEVHGNGRKESADRIEIATVGLAREDARRLKTVLGRVRDAHLAGRDELPRLDVLVEGLDPLRYTASAAKRVGVLRLAERAMHIELPRVARTTHRDAYTALLGDFLSQIGTLLLPPAP